jgi:hypothetical protein
MRTSILTYPIAVTQPAVALSTAVDHRKEHFGHGFAIDDETVREDLRLVDELAEQRP